MFNPTSLIIISSTSAAISLISAIAGIVQGRGTKLSTQDSEVTERDSDALDWLASERFSKFLPLLEKLEESDFFRRIEISDLLPRLEQADEVETAKDSQDV